MKILLSHHIFRKPKPFRFFGGLMGKNRDLSGIGGLTNKTAKVQ
jgi:hypothetical protein